MTIGDLNGCLCLSLPYGETACNSSVSISPSSGISSADSNSTVTFSTSTNGLSTSESATSTHTARSSGLAISSSGAHTLSDNRKANVPVGAISGIVLGGLLLLAIVGGLFLLFVRRKNKNLQVPPSAEVRHSSCSCELTTNNSRSSSHEALVLKLHSQTYSLHLNDLPPWATIVKRAIL